MAAPMLPWPWTNEYLCELVETYKFNAEQYPPLVGYVFKLIKENDYNLSRAGKALHSILSTDHVIDCNVMAVESSLRRLMVIVKGFMKNMKRESNIQGLKTLLESTFTLPKPKRTPKRQAEEPVEETASVEQPPLTLKRDCEKCPGMRKKISLHTKSLKDKFRNLRRDNCELKVKFQAKRVNQDRKRKEVQIKEIKKKVKDLENRNSLLEKELSFYRSCKDENVMKQLRQEKRRTRDLRIRLKKCEEVVNQTRMLEEEKKLLETELWELKKDLKSNTETDEEEKKMDRRQRIYGLPIRKCLYKCLLSQAPVEKAGMLVSFIWKEASGEEIRTPGPSTISQMAYELGVMSDLQIGELINRSSFCTLAWDATSLGGVHVNEVHICTSDGDFTLQIGELPGGRTDDYHDHISKSLIQIAQAYACFTDASFSDTLERFYDSITTTLTDRAAVNHCVTAQLSLLLKKELILLNCNVHPLDGLASATRQALRAVDADFSIPSRIFGSEGRVANLLYAISKLRYKDGAGDPSGFNTFLRSQGLRPGIIVRYRGNRFHVMFHFACTVLMLKDKLIVYLKNFCTAARLRDAILHDLQNNDICLQLQILGLLGKSLTGPWMTLFYGNAANRHHLEMIPFMHRCLSSLTAMESDPSTLLRMDEDVFGQSFSDDADVLSMRLMVTSPNFHTVAFRVIVAMKKLLLRQLKPYLDGRLSQPSRELMDLTQNAPITNMHSERALGMFDSQVKRAPNATIGFVDGKTKAKLNRSLEWFSTKGQLVQEKMHSFIISYAASRRKAASLQSCAVQEERLKRQFDVGKKRDLSERRKVEKNVQSLLDDNDVDQLLSLLDGSIQNLVRSSLLCDECIVGETFNHIWNVDGEDKLFVGKIVGFFSNKKGSSLKVEYCSTSSTIPLKEFVADIIMGDVSLP